tara:strand:+ start:817 stop:1212 length:396 start_codon:yes stop_codon:yes gene_type:complete
MPTTLTPTLTLQDSTTFSDEINFSVTDSLAVTAPSQSLSTVIAPASGVVEIVAASTAIVYLFVRHTGTTNGTTGTAVLVDVEESGGAGFARLGAGEWMFMPFNHHTGSVSIQLHAQAASVVQLEYAYWTKN